jgi:ABC-type branched-subunit amino acid transport system ATPase component/ABC-type branched-subunit amino acid transport system permease subunit
MTVTAEIVVVGLMTGLAYAVLAAGLVLIYRATRVINFAHGEIGAFGAAVLALLVLDHGWNFFVALALVLVIGGAVGAAVELGVIRRLFNAPRLIVLVATIGVAQLLFFAQAILPGVENLSRYPSPIDRTIELGNLLLRSEHFMVLAFVPACVAGLTIFLTRTPYGLGVRAAAENGDAARLAGISVKRVSTLVWVLAAVLATLSAVLLNPLRGGIVGGAMGAALGPGLLLRALAAGLIGRLTSLPLTLVGGVLIGVVEAVLIVNVAAPGAADLAIFALVLGLVLLHRQGGGDEDKGAWSLSPKVAPIPERLRTVWWVRSLPLLGGGAALALALLVPLLLTTSAQLFLLSQVLLYAIVALSLTVLIGWGGQLSLGQFAFVGLGAMTTAALYGRGMSFMVAVAYGTVAGVLAALAIGAPALRVRGLHLAITTLGFAVMARGWLFTQDVFLSEGSVVTVPRGTLGPVDLTAPRTYYYLCLTALVVCVLMVSRLRASGVGRTLIAVRDNAPSASAFTVSPTTAKLTAFAVSGGLAAFAGGLLGGLRVQFGAEAFGVSESLRVVAMTVIGGLGSVAGSVMGAVYVVGAPAVFQGSQAAALLTSGIGLLVLLLYFPGGLAQLLYRLRDSLLALADRRLAVSREGAGPVPAPSVEVTPRPTSIERPDAASVTDRPALQATDVSVRFGGRLALDGVSVRADHGEVVGLIGSNGAGKSTLMNVVSGFIRPETGRIRLHDRDITPLLPHERARAGLGRVFQDARLFGDLTVTEAVKVALEGRERSETVPSMLWLPPARRAERAKTAQAAELVGFLGLGRYADSFISSLSTGTRRIAELACLLALQPRVILLDEPTAGVAQRETEAFGPLLRRIAGELSATLVVIEHDMPLIMSISDRVYCLSAGQVIAEGDPAEVRSDPAVVAAYLGTDERAIERSDTAVPVGGGA